ncbi:DeoR/GlpR family DNA-binding transcription regulator [Xylanimonas sp. McL0601]|uniref:DeoR/GlpR family DNA-binding transcription regulator n=1 Tax=Xylanimonas sp. McL0601 TaxID=3414739 RepID=UPI003CF2BEFD
MTTDTPVIEAGSRKRSRRFVQILDLVAERGTVSVPDLVAALGISPATARRDLTELAEHRLVVRTHGGVTALDHGVSELPLELRNTRFPDAKSAIARAVAVRIPHERHAVALSGGTTTARVAVELTSHQLLTIVTNSLTIAELIHTYPALRVVVSGGSLRPQSLEFVGPVAERTFGALNVSTAILGADGIAASAGVTTYDETEARTNRAMVGSAQRTIVVADGSKIGRVTLAQMVPLDHVSTLITDTSADPEELERIRSTGVEVVVA